MLQAESTNISEQIKTIISQYPIVIFMKGTEQFPACGFSAQACSILKQAGAKSLFCVDILLDSQMREGIKRFSQWPTLPQVYVRGEFIGGCDIVTELFHEGKLQKIIDQAMAD